MTSSCVTCLLWASNWKITMSLDPVTRPLHTKWLLILMDSRVSAIFLNVKLKPTIREACHGITKDAGFMWCIYPYSSGLLHCHWGNHAITLFPKLESSYRTIPSHSTWIRLQRYDCLVTCFCYQLIAKPGNKTTAPPWPDPYRLQWVRWRLKSPTSRWFTQPFVHSQMKENIKAPRHWPCDPWIPRTKGQ